MIQKIKKTFYPAFGKLKSFTKRYIVADPLFIATQQFKRDDHRLDLRGTYDLGPQSVIFDLGGYVGDWSLKMSEKYGSNIYIFEPVKGFLEQARAKFADNPKVHLFDFGLSDKDGEETISSDADASSVFAGTGDMTIVLRDVKAIIEELKIQKIDLLKLNIEGGEFHVLPRMIECGLVPMCTDIQVQFHHFYPDAERLRGEIRTALAKTHHLTYDYPFAFENWRKNA